MDVHFKLGKFRTSNSHLAGIERVLKKNKASQSTWFLKGPIPGDWLQAASGLGGHALHVGLALWHLVGLTRKKEVKLTHRILERFKTLPDSGSRGLKMLEKEGLVSVVRKLGSCHLVTIIEVIDSENMSKPHDS